MLEVAATTPSNPLVGGRVVDISLLTNDAAGRTARLASRKDAGTPLKGAARPSSVTLFYTPIERAIPKQCLDVDVEGADTEVTVVTRPASYKQQELTSKPSQTLVTSFLPITWLRAAGATARIGYANLLWAKRK